MLLNYEQKIKHIRTVQDHEKYILTSSKFASAWQISSLALACDKIVSKKDGEYMKSPYLDLNENSSQGSHITSPQLNNEENNEVKSLTVNDN